MDLREQGWSLRRGVIDMELEMVFIYHNTRPEPTKMVKRIPEAGLYELYGEVTSGVSIAISRLATIDCGVPITIGYRNIPVPKPHTHVAGIGILYSSISFSASPLFTPLFGKVTQTSTVGEKLPMHLVTAIVLDEAAHPRWDFDWRPTMFSHAVPRPAGLQTRIEKDGNLYRASVSHPTDENCWMSIGPRPQQELQALLVEMGWDLSEIEPS